MAALSESVLTLVIGLFFVFGTASTMTSKLLFQFEGEGLNGDHHKFEKPLFQATMMFVGMALCMFVHWAGQIGKASETNGESAPLLANQNGSLNHSKPAKPDYRVYYVVAVPALCDFLATYMMTVGLLWVNASIFQMVRGSIVLFSALIRWLWLGKKIYSFQWAGVFIVMFGEVLVGYSAIAAGDEKEKIAPGVTLVIESTPEYLKLLGIALIFLAQLVQALQVVVEEHLLHNINASAYLVVGLEGVWGLILCVFVSAPLAYYIGTKGLHEDMFDTFAMMKNDPIPLIPVTVAYTLTILGFNVTAMKITESINSVTRCVLDTVRTIFIWILMTIAHYYISPAYGEPWTRWCYLELLGFAVLMFGLFTYYQVITMPSLFNYPNEDEQVKDPVLATPLLTPQQRRKARGDTPLVNKYGSGPTNLVSVSSHGVGSIGVSGSLVGAIERANRRAAGSTPSTPLVVSSPRI